MHLFYEKGILSAKIPVKDIAGHDKETRLNLIRRMDTLAKFVEFDDRYRFNNIIESFLKSIEGRYIFLIKASGISFPLLLNKLKIVDLEVYKHIQNIDFGPNTLFYFQKISDMINLYKSNLYTELRKQLDPQSLKSQKDSIIHERLIQIVISRELGVKISDNVKKEISNIDLNLLDESITGELQSSLKEEDEDIVDKKHSIDDDGLIDEFKAEKAVFVQKKVSSIYDTIESIHGFDKIYNNFKESVDYNIRLFYALYVCYVEKFVYGVDKMVYYTEVDYFINLDKGYWNSVSLLNNLFIINKIIQLNFNQRNEQISELEKNINALLNKPRSELISYFESIQEESLFKTITLGLVIDTYTFKRQLVDDHSLFKSTTSSPDNMHLYDKNNEINEFGLYFKLKEDGFITKLTKDSVLNTNVEQILNQHNLSYVKNKVEYPFIYDFIVEKDGEEIYLNVISHDKLSLNTLDCLVQEEEIKLYYLNKTGKKVINIRYPTTFNGDKTLKEHIEESLSELFN